MMELQMIDWKDKQKIISRFFLFPAHIVLATIHNSSFFFQALSTSTHTYLTNLFENETVNKEWIKYI